MPKKFEDAVSAVLAGANPEVIADEILSENATPAETVDAAPVPVKKVTIGSAIESMLMDVEMSYNMIVDAIHLQFENASTSARSVASVAARLRKAGVDIPHRRKTKGDVA